MTGACPAVQGAGEVDRAGEAEDGQDQPRLQSERGFALMRRQDKLLGADTGEQLKPTKVLK